MEDIVDEILQKDAEKKNKYKSTEVVKDLDLEIDLGNLLAIDNNIIDLKDFRSNKDEYLKNLARDDTQLLINQIWRLPAEPYEDVIVVKLPDPKTRLPREKPIPKPKPLTKWEKYAKDKGIQKHTKSKLVWDEAEKDWLPRYGFRKANDEKKDWVLEVPDNADPYEDQFAKKKEAKKERIAKNEMQRLRNISKANKIKVPAVGIAPVEKPSINEVSKALSLAKQSTASLGKFTEKLPKEKPLRKQGKKRKFEPVFGDVNEEKRKNLNILEKIHSKKPHLDVTKAVNKEAVQTDQKESPKKQFKKGKKGKKNRLKDQHRRPKFHNKRKWKR